MRLIVPGFGRRTFFALDGQPVVWHTSPQIKMDMRVQFRDVSISIYLFFNLSANIHINLQLAALFD